MSLPGSRLSTTDPHATRNDRVLACRHLVEPFVRRYAARGVSSDDLRQVAYLALVQAADRFDPDQGHAFEAFAGVTIDGSLKRYFRDSTWAVRPPRGLQDLLLRIRASRNQLDQRLGREPTVEELASDLGVDVDHVVEALVASAARGSWSVTGDASGDRPGATADRWLGSTDPGFGRAEALLVLHEAIELLDDRDRELLRLRFVENLSQRQISELVGLSQSYVSRVISSILLRLRHRLDGFELV